MTDDKQRFSCSLPLFAVASKGSKQVTPGYVSHKLGSAQVQGRVHLNHGGGRQPPSKIVSPFCLRVEKPDWSRTYHSNDRQPGFFRARREHQLYDLSSLWCEDYHRFTTGLVVVTSAID